MFIYTSANAAPLHTGPKLFAPIINYIPNFTKVEAQHFNGLWYRVIWQGQAGYMPAQYLCAQNLSPAKWQPRYGASLLSIALAKEPNCCVQNLQNDLNLFFHPFQPQVFADGIFGCDTRAALMHFQRIRGLAIHGAATPETKASLYAATIHLHSDAIEELW
jgi:peptidoglycan hydrolase-like protein with peptidoglycan-binding domain